MQQALNLNQFNPIRDIGNAFVTTANQVIGTGIQTAGQINAGLASTILSVVNGVPAPPTPPPPPAVQMPNLGNMGQNMNIAPTGAKEDDFDVVE